MKHSTAREITDSLLKWIEFQNFKGWDPFDALNSPILKDITKIHRWFGIAALQAVKRSAINLRIIFLVPKTKNSKGIGLILAASVIRYKLWKDESDLERAMSLANWLEVNSLKGYAGFCWGHPFDWPNRAFFAPKGTPTIVNTSFIGHALLDLYELTRGDKWLSLALSSCEFLLKDIKRTERGGTICFSYTPIDNSCVHNANLLGASLLARTGKLTGRSDLMDLAVRSTLFSIIAQKEDGSWSYGEARNQAWIDSFHTGYNILALKAIYDATNNGKIKDSFLKGFIYYLDKYFLSDGTVKYYHNKTEPLDAHAFANAVICLTEIANVCETPSGLVEKVLDRMVELFWPGKDYFYWQIKNGVLYKLPCMRWVQAWVLLAITKYLYYKEIK